MATKKIWHYTKEEGTPIEYRTLIGQWDHEIKTCSFIKDAWYIKLGGKVSKPDRWMYADDLAALDSEPVPAKVEKPRCGNCRFGVGDESYWWCHRFPPKVLNAQEREAIEDEIPQVDPVYDWCGEHQPKVEE